MLTIAIFKWLFVLSTILLSIYHYRLERSKINKISKSVKDPKLISELRTSARTRMGHFFLLFAALIIWIMSYDIEIENVNKEKEELTHELDKASNTYSNLSDNQKRLVEAKPADENVVNDIENYYSDVFVNYYVMRKCNLAGGDDAFIINSAMVRELSLNNVSLEARDEIISQAKTKYTRKYSNFECDQIHGKYNDIIKSYQNYIIAVREILRATF